ncbi:MAG: hypothetical protein QG630_104 [Patescibacteria group bacterium]|nr:hypothetical protein [Patescibacteria group bacterium]
MKKLIFIGVFLYILSLIITKMLLNSEIITPSERMNISIWSFLSLGLYFLITMYVNTFPDNPKNKKR